MSTDIKLNKPQDQEQGGSVIFRLKRRKENLPYDYLLIDEVNGDETNHLENKKKKYRLNQEDYLVKEFAEKLEIHDKPELIPSDKKEQQVQEKKNANAVLSHQISNHEPLSRESKVALEQDLFKQSDEKSNPFKMPEQLEPRTLPAKKLVLQKIQLDARNKDDTKTQLLNKLKSAAQDSSQATRQKLLNAKRPYIVDIQINEQSKQINVIKEQKVDPTDKDENDDSDSSSQGKNKEADEYEEDLYMIQRENGIVDEKIEEKNCRIQHLICNSEWITKYQQFDINGNEVIFDDECEYNEEGADSEDSNRSSNPNNTYGEEENSEEEKSNGSKQDRDSQNYSNDESNVQSSESDTVEAKKVYKEIFEEGFKERMKKLKHQKQYHGNAQNDFEYEEDF